MTEQLVALRFALAQIDCVVGDLVGNTARVVERTAQAAAAGAQIVTFPEMMVTGYPVEDLVLRASFRAASRAALEALAGRLAEAGLGDVAVIVGYVDDDGLPRDASAFLHGGQVVARCFKHHLPNYGVFDERRYFAPGTALTVVRHLGVDIALTVCEDLWQEGVPFTVAGQAGVGVVVNVNASPYERNKDDVRLALLQTRAAAAGAPIVYVNTVGGQDELVFDGDSMVVSTDGTLLSRAPQFVEGVYLVDIPVVPAPAEPPAAAGTALPVAWTASAGATDSAPALDLQPAVVTERIGDEAEVWNALVLGLRDYVVKNGFRSVVLGVSGGIDSAVVAAIAADAIGGANVHGIALPSAYSSEHSRSDAEDLARRIGAKYREVAIKPMVDAFVSALSLHGIAEENVQARIRGTTLMALSNSEGHLVLATGNKSELAVGYSTIYGDAVGGFAPIKDVPKTLVWALARWRNAQAEAAGQIPPIPPNSITKEPSAELRPGQLDSDSLPDYAELDAILARYVDGDRSAAEIVADGFDPTLVERVAHMVDAAEWKRRQYPPGTKISFKAFGRDRRVPITNKWSERAQPM